jgi:hypothetical protein
VVTNVNGMSLRWLILCENASMKSLLIFLPCSLVVSLLVAEVAIATLGLPGEPAVLIGIIAISTMLLYERGLAELGIIGAISLFAQANAQGLGSQVVAPDMLLGLVLAVIFMPVLLRTMGLSTEKLRIS